jgi:histidinol-phosphate phosphatase family protein
MNDATTSMSRCKALILAAGLGTRLRPLTDTIPKCLLPIAGKPVLDYWIDLLGDIGVREILINTHTFPGQVQDWIQQQNSGGCRRVQEFFEPELLGSAGTIAANGDYADDVDCIVIVYADNLSNVDLTQMVRFHDSHHGPMTMLLFRTPDPQACGIVELDADDRIIGFQEKPANPRSDLANAGLYIVDADAYREIAALRAFDIGFDVLPVFVNRARGWIWDGFHRDIGTQKAYDAAQQSAAPILAARGVQLNGRQRAVFLDRDGTLIRHVHYLSDAAQVQLLPGVAEALRELRRAGYRCIVVSNQSAVGRGLLTHDQLDVINNRMCEMLASNGAVVDAIYSCPVVPQLNDRSVIEHPDRKPGPGMLLRAAREHDLDLSQSWMVGDMVSDALAGINAGCLGAILVDTGKSEAYADGMSGATITHVVDVAAAVKNILQNPTARIQ